MSRKKENNIGQKQLYQLYTELFPCEVDYKTYMEITTEFNDFIIQKIIQNYVFTSPNNVGLFFVSQIKQTFEFDEKGKITKTTARIDIRETMKLWEKFPHFRFEKRYVYYENNHTDGRKMKIRWRKRTLQGVKPWVFTPCRTFKRTLGKYIKANPHTEYYGN